MKENVKSTIEKLEDVSLKNVSGGVTPQTVVRRISAVAAALSVPSALGCGIASCVYMSKANKAHVAGDVLNYGKYIRKAQNCGIAAASCLGATIIAATVVTKVPENLKDEVALNPKGYTELRDNLNQLLPATPQGGAANA